MHWKKSAFYIAHDLSKFYQKFLSYFLFNGKNILFYKKSIPFSALFDLVPYFYSNFKGISAPFASIGNAILIDLDFFSFGNVCL